MEHRRRISRDRKILEGHSQSGSLEALADVRAGPF
jgi:hypothetical protein